MFEFVFGGSGSGKSSYAETKILEITKNEKKIYLATMQSFGEEGKRRIERHKKMREGKNFITIEKSIDVENILIDFEKSNDNYSLLLECLSNLVANEMFRENKKNDENFVVAKILNGLKKILQCKRIINIVIVSSNVFNDGINYDDDCKKYMMALGKLNMEFAKIADTVTEVVAGIPIRIK